MSKWVKTGLEISFTKNIKLKISNSKFKTIIFHNNKKSFILEKNFQNQIKEKMKLKRFLLRYYPPGIILEYVKKNGEIETKSIDLLNLSSE